MRHPTVIKRLKNSCAMLLIAALGAQVQAATTDLANVPLVSASSTSVLPNIFLMMDDSGSMNWTHMPDEAADGGSSVPMTYGYYGLRSAQCNGLYYTPTIKYLAPVKADGTNYSNSSFTGAWVNGFNTGAGTLNLSTSFIAGDQSNTNRQSRRALYVWQTHRYSAGLHR